MEGHCLLIEVFFCHVPTNGDNKERYNGVDIVYCQSGEVNKHRIICHSAPSPGRSWVLLVCTRQGGFRMKTGWLLM